MPPSMKEFFPAEQQCDDAIAIGAAVMTYFLS